MEIGVVGYHVGLIVSFSEWILDLRHPKVASSILAGSIFFWTFLAFFYSSCFGGLWTCILALKLARELATVRRSPFEIFLH